MKAIRTLKKLITDDAGISAVEYALLLALIGAGIAVAATTLGTNAATKMTEAATQLQ